MPDLALSSLHGLSHNHGKKVIMITIPILQVRKLRLKEDKSVVPGEQFGHRACK